MTIETDSYCDATAKALAVEREPSHVDRALGDLEKSDAELAYVIDVLATRLHPVSAFSEAPTDVRGEAADPSERSPIVRSIRDAVGRTQRLTRIVSDLTDRLDV